MNRLLATLLGLSSSFLLAPDNGAGSGASGASGDAVGNGEPPEASGADSADALLLSEGDDLDAALGIEPDDDGDFDPFDDGDDPLGLGTDEDPDGRSDEPDYLGLDGDPSNGEENGADDETGDGEPDGDASDASQEDGTDGDGEPADPQVILAAELPDAVRAQILEAIPGSEVRTMGDVVRDLGQLTTLNNQMVEAQNTLDQVLQMDPGLANAIVTAADALKKGETVNLLGLLAKHVDGVAIEDVDAYADPDERARVAEATAYQKHQQETAARTAREREAYVADWKKQADQEYATLETELGTERTTLAAQTLHRFANGTETGGVFRMPRLSEMIQTIDKGLRFDEELKTATEAARKEGLAEGLKQAKDRQRLRKTGGTPQLSGGSGRAKERKADLLGLDEGYGGPTIHDQF